MIDRVFVVVSMIWTSALAADDSATTRDARISSLIHSVDVVALIGNPVTDSDWQQVARIEGVLVNPESGLATFVVLSFVDREGMLAVPWNDLIIDELGRASLPDPNRSIARAVRFHGQSRFHPPPATTSVDDRSSDDRSSPIGPSQSGYRIEVEGEGLVHGEVIGSILLPGEPGEPSENDARHMLAVVEAGDETVQVDLGPQRRLEALGIRIEPGETLQVSGRHPVGSADRFVASAIRWDQKWVDLHHPGQFPSPRD